MSLDEHEDSLPQGRMRTRAQNQTRRPGKQIGLNWQAQIQEQQEAAAAKAEKKAAAEKKKREKAAATKHRARGVHKIAELELAREREDVEDEQYIQTSTAHGYRKTTLASRPQEPDAISSSDCDQELSETTQESSHDHDAAAAAAADNDDDDDDDDDDPAPQVNTDACLVLEYTNYSVVQKKTNAQRRQGKRVHTREEIDIARQEISAKKRSHAKPCAFHLVASSRADLLL